MFNNLLRENIRNLKAYEVKEMETIAKLDANENNNVSYLLNEELAKAIADLKINQYPDSDSTALRGILGDKLALSPEELMVACGSDQLISIIVNSFVGEGDKILTPVPTFGMYKLVAGIAGGQTVEMEMGEDFLLDYSAFIDLMERERPKIVFLTNPNNPTGGTMAREEIIRIIKLAKGIVVVDEAYYEFYGESVLDLINDFPNLIVLRTLSKAYGLAGARIGYAAACQELMEILYRVKPPYNVANLSQLAARVCLDNEEIMTRSVREIIKERDKLILELRKMDKVKVFDSQANFILCQLKGAREVYDFLLENKVLVRYFNDKYLENCLRISIGKAKENQLLLNLLKGALDTGKLGEMGD